RYRSETATKGSPSRSSSSESWLSTYDRSRGVDLEWYQFEHPDYVAGGMALVDEDTLLLGHGSSVDRYDLSANTLTPLARLVELGIDDVQGMVIDRDQGTLLVLDGADHELVEIALTELLTDGAPLPTP